MGASQPRTPRAGLDLPSKTSSHSLKQRPEAIDRLPETPEAQAEQSGGPASSVWRLSLGAQDMTARLGGRRVQGTLVAGTDVRVEKVELLALGWWRAHKTWEA